MNACSLSILLQSHHANPTHTQFRPFSAHAPPVRPQSAPDPPQHMHACVCFTHDPSPFRSGHNFLLSNQPATHAVLFPQFLCQCHQARLSSTPTPPNHQFNALQALPAFLACPVVRNTRLRLLFLLQIIFLSCFGLCTHPHITTRAPTQHSMTVCMVFTMYDPWFMLKAAHLVCASPANITKTHNPTLLSSCAFIIEAFLEIIT
jgi:hypothetical protein